MSECITQAEILQRLKTLKPSLTTRYGVTRLALFGSYAHEMATEVSDIDLVVEMAEPDLFSLVHIKEELENHFNKPVDLIPYSETMNGYLKKRITMDALYV
jgi:predicted nucleotidyltransferase